MKIPFYQTDWFNMDLVSMAQKISYPLAKVADERVYQAVYDELYACDYKNISADWVEKKLRLSAWLGSFFSKRKLNDSSIISVGCGLGIVEQALIKVGLNIDLQECQDSSVKYFQTRYPAEFDKVKFILSTDLSNIPDRSYDVVMALTSSYCLDDYVLSQFLESIHRILCPKGIFIWYETALRLHDFIIYIRQKLTGKQLSGLNWGWKRRLKDLQDLATTYGLLYEEGCYLDVHNKEIDSSHIMGMPCNNLVTWQIMIYKKND